MDFGELILYILIGSGLLSQLFGGKKKQQPPRQRRPAPPPPPRAAAGGAAPGATTARKKASSYMERILKELELDDLVEQSSRTSEPPVATRPPTKTEAPARFEPPRYEPSYESTVRSYDADAVDEEEVPRPLPAPEGRSLESLEPSGAAEHERFHDLFVKPLGPGQVSRTASRVSKLLNNKKLRDAMLLKEIIGPPKALE